MNIPKIIHQTWKHDDIPHQFLAFSDSWKKYHPDWQFMLWTDEMNIAFVSSYFPEFLDRYNSYPANIQRVDAVRYLILLKYGGIFIDLDYECFRNVEPLIADHTCVFSEEPEAHCRENKKQRIVTNAIMASVAGHHFLKYLYDFLRAIDYTDSTDPHISILESTGPFMLTNAYNTFTHKDSVAILGADILSPLTKKELSRYHKRRSEPLQKKISSAYAMHHYYGTWWKNDII